MRNKSKKLIAIMAAMMIAGSTVAATASVSVSAAVDVGTVDTSTIKVSVDGTPQASDNKVYKTETGTENTDLAAVSGVYNYGEAVKPVEATLAEKDGVKGVYVKYTDGTDKYAFVPVSVAYENNVNAGKAKAIISGSTTQVLNSKTVVVTLRIEQSFNIAKATFAGTKVPAAVKKTWNGGKLTVNKTELPLSRTIPAVPGVSEAYDVSVDSSLYTISNIKEQGGGTAPEKVKEKDGVLSFEAVPGTYDVTYSITDAAKDNFTNDAVNTVAAKAVVIEKANWNDVVVEYGDQTNTGTPNVTVTLNGNVLKQGTHYIATSTQATAGDNTLAKVTVKPMAATNMVDDTYFKNGWEAKTGYAAIGSNIATKISSVRLTDPTKLSFAYTGSEIKPAVTVTTYNNETLTEGVDYEIVYKDNVDVGTNKTIVVKGIGKYAGTVTASSKYNIVAAELKDQTTTAADVTYEDKLPTTKDLFAAIKVNNGVKDLVLGEDYDANLVGSIKEGANQVRLIAKGGNYKGTTTVTVNVKKVTDLSTATVANIANVVYTGAEVKPTVAVMMGDKTLVEGTDYTVAYTNNVETGLATATVTGTGAYKGTVSKNFVIVPEKVTGLKAKKKTTTTLKLTFNAVHGADGYKIYDAVTGKALASVSTQGGKDVLTKTIKGLNPGEKRQYKVRAYKVVNGTKRYAAYSDIYTKATAAK